MARAVALADRVAELGASALVVGEPGTGKRRLLRRISLRPDAPPRPEAVIDCKRSRRAFSSALEQLAAVTHPIWRMPTRLQLIGLDHLDAKQFDALVQTIWGHFYLCSGLQILATSEVGPDELASLCPSAARVVAAAANEIVVPPLRERGADVPLLAHAILRRQCTTAGIARMRVAPDTSELLRRYAWPGNFPELEEVLGWATTTADPTKRYIFARDLPSSLQDEDAVDRCATIPPNEEGLTLSSGVGGGRTCSADRERPSRSFSRSSVTELGPRVTTILVARLVGGALVRTRGVRAPQRTRTRLRAAVRSCSDASAADPSATRGGVPSDPTPHG